MQKTMLRYGLTATLLAVSLAQPARAGDPSLAAYENDPRSSAAIIGELIRAGKIKATAPVSRTSSRTILTGTVNDPSFDASVQDTQSETTVADFGNGKLISAYNDSSAYGTGSNHFTGYSYSTNGGLSWVDGGTLPTSVNGDGGDPVLGVRMGTNRAYMVSLANVNGFLNLFKSNNSGQTWTAPVNAAPGFGGTDFLDKPWLAVDNYTGANAGNVYVCFTRFGATEDVYFTRSTDSGVTFGPSPGTLISAGGQGCFITVSPNHQVTVFYYRGTGSGGQGGDNKLFSRRSTNGGASFGAEVMVADLATISSNGNLGLNGGIRSNSFPHAAVNPDPAKPYIYVVYNDDTVVSTADNSNVFIVKSTNAGATWSAPVAVDATARDQFFPTIAFSAPGKMMVSYYSRSMDPDNLAFQRRARLALLSATGSPVFKNSFQLGPNTPLVLGQDPVVNTSYMGDYDQIAGVNGHLSATWADNRSGNTFHSNQPDVHFAQVNGTPTPTDLVLTASAATLSPAALQPDQVRVRVKANGGAARDVFLSLRAQPGLRLEAPSDVNCVIAGSFMSCNLGAIALNATRDVYFTLRGSAPAGSRQVVATVTSSNIETAPATNNVTTTFNVTAAGMVTASYTTGNIAVAIPDNGSTTVNVVVPDAGTVARVVAKVRVNHTWDGDVHMTLISPTGVRTNLVAGRGGSANDFGTGANDCTGSPTVFDDTAANNIAAGAPPFSGSFRPEQALARNLAQPSGGTWTMQFQDTQFIDTGTVGCVTLDITRKP